MSKVPNARAVALMLLDGVLRDGQMLSQMTIPEALPPQEQARAQRLATGVLRHIDYIDCLFAPFLRKKPTLEALNILRLACYEMYSGAAPHGVINASVEASKTSLKLRHMSGLLNAVLRNVARALQDDGAPPFKPNMLPRWLRQPLVRHYGRDAVSAIELAHAQTPPMDLTYAAPPAQIPDGAVRLPNGSVRVPQGTHISALEGFDRGAFWVQDAAASFAAQLLAPQKGARVLDLCAAPGGKTMQLAAAGAQVTALDISPARIARLEQNLQRTGLAAQVIAADALHWHPDAPFDAILLDAPCSASGTLRRHPDLPFVKDDSALEALCTLQAQMIDRAMTWLKPNGRMVFVTCSLLPQEGEAQLEGLLARHPNARVVPPQEALPWVDPAWVTPQGALRLRPDYWLEYGGMDGFFMVCVQI